jgi:Na+-driven multidrug efflux pump
MNKDNPLTDIITFLGVLVVLSFAWVIGKALLEKDKIDHEKKEGKNIIGSIIRNIIFLVVGALLLYFFSDLWLSFFGWPK